jgi:hypothetical protein
LLAALSASLVLTGAADARAADSLTISASEAPQAGVAMTIAARGSSNAPSRLRVFVQQGGDCAAGTGGAAANATRQAAKSGSTEVIDAETSGAFNYAASYTPPVAGTYKICAYVFRSGPNGSMSSQVSQAFSVSEPPPAAPGSTPGAATDDTVAPKSNCVVPRLYMRMYATARKRLHAAGCIVGKVVRPSKKKAAPVRRGGRRRILKVLSQSPKPGAVLKARARVNLRLVYVTPKTASKIN